MRELPEPDGEFYSWANQYRVQSKQGWSKESVLAIQKQAYEDGLRDAAKLCEKERLEFVEQAARNDGRHSDMAFGSVNSAERIMGEIAAMLTASQEKK